jgi:CRISPR-associated protein Csm2
MLILTTVTVTTSINGGLINSTQSAKEEARGMDVAEAKEMWKMSVREDRENGVQEKTLDQILEELKKVKDSKSQFLLFCRYMEALVAYRKFSGRDE